MSNGHWVLNLRTKVPNPLADIWPNPATVEIGPYSTKTWNGGDAIASHPRSFYRTRPIGPKEMRKHPERPKNLRMAMPPQPYNLVKGTANAAAHRLWYKAGKRFETYVDQNQGSYDTYDGPDVYYKALADLGQHGYGSGFAPLVFLAEGHQALAMIANSAIRIAQAINGLTRGNPLAVLNALGISAPSSKWVKRVGMIKRRGTTTRAVSSLWLEVQYGWLPLLSDVEAGAGWIATYLNSGTTPLRYVGRASKITEGKLIGYPISPVVWGTERLKHKVKLTFYGEFDSVFLPNIASVAEVAWEVLPFSFVADWFLPVGSYIAACKVARSLKGTFVVTESREYDYFNIVSKDPGYDYLGVMVGSAGSHSYAMTRVISTTPPVPPPWQNLDDKYQGYKSWRHAANALALVSQAVSNFRGKH